MIGILDYGFGNLKSVFNAVYSQGFDPEIVAGADRFDDLTHMIIPGVGAFDAAMGEMHRRELVGPVLDFAKSGRPVLGICLGMQLLADYGEEIHGADGLGLVAGKVVAMRPTRELVVPHCGWNTVRFRAAHPLLAEVKPAADFYFVHSYKFDCADPEALFGTTDYGEDFCSAVARKNVVGLQFHPEKSQANGLRLLESFCRWDGRC